MPFAPIPNGQLYYETAGAGPALLFVTGLGGLAAFWRNQVEAFSSRYSVITYDHRGTGKSARTDAPYSIEQMAADTLALLDHLGVEQTILVGHSTGGAIGLCLAANHAQRVQRLGLSATWTHADPYFRRLFETRRQVLVHGDGLLYQKLSALMLFPPEWIARNEAAMREREAQAPTDPLDIRILMRRIDAIVQHDGRAWARAVRCPTRIVVARDDTITPAYFSQALAELIPHATLEILDRGGHSAPVIESQVYNAVLDGLL
jgi:aminoacrylate hydrolase